MTWLVFDPGGVLIDDRPINVDGARDPGWQVLRYTGVDELQAALAALGLCPAARSA